MATYTSLKNFSVRLPGEGGNQALLMPKLKFRFRVIFTGFGTLGDTEVAEMTRQVVDVKRPSVKFDKQTLDVYNSKINYAGKPTWEPVTMKIRDDVSGAASLLIAKQVQKQFDFYEQSAATSAGDYKFDMAIEMTDGGNGAADAAILERWICYGCFIDSADYDTLDYKGSEPVQISLTITMDNCVQQLGDPKNPIPVDGGDDMPGVGSDTTKTRVGGDASSYNMVYSESNQP